MVLKRVSGESLSTIVLSNQTFRTLKIKRENIIESSRDICLTWGGVLGRTCQSTINYPLVFPGKRGGEEENICTSSENHRNSANEAEQIDHLATANHFYG